MPDKEKAPTTDTAAKAPPLHISIQGYEGSFHQMAAQQFFGKSVTVIPCATFRELVKIAGNKKESDGGIMAIENSIAGSILPNYQLLQKSGLVVTGEIYLQIRQNLLVNPGVTLDDIKEVHSHSMAIQQCLAFWINTTGSWWKQKIPRSAQNSFTSAAAGT